MGFVFLHSVHGIESVGLEDMNSIQTSSYVERFPNRTQRQKPIVGRSRRLEVRLSSVQHTTGLIPFGWRQQRARIEAKRVSSASVLRVTGAMGTWSGLGRLPCCRL